MDFQHKIPALITVRTQSKRLPEKCLLSFGENRVIEHIIERAKYKAIFPIICTTNEKEDDVLCEIASKNDIPFFRGSTINKLDRWMKCADKFGFESFTTIDADDPFFCPEEVIRSYELLNSKNLDFVEPYSSSSSGSAMVGYSLKTSLIKNAIKNLPSDTDTEMGWTFLGSEKNKNSIKLPPPLKYEVKGRLTLDYWEDYIFLEALRLLLGRDTSRKNIFSILTSNLNLIDINSFRADEWAKNQREKSNPNYLKY